MGTEITAWWNETAKLTITLNAFLMTHVISYVHPSRDHPSYK